MKKNLFLLAFLLVIVNAVRAQDTIAPAPADKAVVYIVRVSSLGLAINFSYFDSAMLIGRFNGPKYIRYECAPGHHLFWARSENKDFVEAELEAGKIYFLEAEPQMGMLKAAVKLKPIDTKNEKKMKKVLKLMKKRTSESFTPEQIAADTKELDNVIEKALKRYSEDKEKNVERLTPSMSYEPKAE